LLHRNSDNDIEVYEQSPVDYLRWDHADLVSYHFITGQRLQLVLDQMHEFDQLEERNRCSIPEYIDNISKSITDILVQSSYLTVPHRKKHL